MNRILAIAKPNLRYKYRGNYKNVLIQAILRETRISYYEIHTDNEKWIKRLSEPLIKSLFEASSLISEQPFLKKENQDFITILYRHKKKYREEFEKLINPSPTMRRRSKPKIKRGK